MGDRETARLEAFSDAVFAIAITLLALELRVPQLPEAADGAALGRALLAEWPSYLAFVISFGTILVMWINHHWLLRIITRSDQVFLLLNGLLLMLITAVPFPTSLASSYLTRPGASLAVAVWGTYFAVVAIAFNVLWRYARRGRRLIGPDVPQALIDSVHQRYRFGPLFYLVAAVLALVFVPLSVAVNVGLAVLFAIPHPARTLPPASPPPGPN